MKILWKWYCKEDPIVGGTYENSYGNKRRISEIFIDTAGRAQVMLDCLDDNYTESGVETAYFLYDFALSFREVDVRKERGW